MTAEFLLEPRRVPGGRRRSRDPWLDTLTVSAGME